MVTVSSRLVPIGDRKWKGSAERNGHWRQQGNCEHCLPAQDFGEGHVRPRHYGRDREKATIDGCRRQGTEADCQGQALARAATGYAGESTNRDARPRRSPNPAMNTATIVLNAYVVGTENERQHSRPDDLAGQ